MEAARVVVGVLVYDEQGRIFLARSHKWGDLWVVPGGHLEWGEKLEECAKREVKEETNLDIDSILLIDVQESVFSTQFHAKKHMVFLDYCARALNKDVVLNDELQEYRWVSPKDALNFDLNEATRIFIEKFMEKNNEKRI